MSNNKFLTIFEPFLPIYCHLPPSVLFNHKFLLLYRPSGSTANICRKPHQKILVFDRVMCFFLGQDQLPRPLLAENRPEAESAMKMTSKNHEKKSPYFLHGWSTIARKVKKKNEKVPLWTTLVFVIDSNVLLIIQDAIISCSWNVIHISPLI